MFLPSIKISLATILGLLVLLTATKTATASFGPFLGCDDDYAYGVSSSSGTECYAVDIDTCEFRYDSDCREVTSTVRYYNGGATASGAQPFPEDVYQEITISAIKGCNSNSNSNSATTTNPQQPSRCTIVVDGETCNSCTNTGNDYRTVTMVDCSNIPGVFPAATESPPPIISVASPGGGHFPLAAVEERCAHPALAVMTAPPVRTIALQPQFQYSMSSPNTGQTRESMQPSNAEIETLVRSSETYFSALLGRLFSNDVQGLSMDNWTSKYVSSGTAATLSAELYLNLTMTINLFDDSPTMMTTRITDYMTNAPTMHGYLESTVKPAASPVFVPTYQVTATVGGESP